MHWHLNGIVLLQDKAKVLSDVRSIIATQLGTELEKVCDCFGSHLQYKHSSVCQLTLL